MTQALQERDLRDLLWQPRPGAGYRRKVRRVRWRLRPRVALLFRFLGGAAGWSLAALAATGDPRLDGLASLLVAWALAAGASLWVLRAGLRPWWVRGLAALAMPLLAAGWVVGAAQQLLPIGTGASTALVGLSLGAFGLRLVGFPWEAKAFGFLPVLGVLMLPLEAGWAAPGAGQYTLVSAGLLWGLAAFTIPVGEGTGWTPRVLSWDSAAEETPTAVGVLGTLGDLHLDPRFRHYDLDVLEAQVRAFRPDILCVAMSPQVLLQHHRSPRLGSVSVEYQQCLLPLAEAEAIPVIPVDTADEDLLVLERAVGADPHLTGIGRVERDRMLSLWQRTDLGLLAVNDPEAQSAAQRYHEARLTSAPEVEQLLWRQRNEGLVGSILDVLRENPGRRVLVVAGAERVYSLQEALAKESGFELFPPGTV